MQQAQFPRHGQSGRPVEVLTNSFAITNLPTVAFHQYHVITQVDPTKGRKVMQAGQRYTEIIEKMQDQHSQDFQPRASYDGMSNLYRTQRLNREIFEVRMARNPASNRGVFEVQLSYAATIERQAFANLVQANTGEYNPQNLDIAPVNLLQVLISQSPHIRGKYLAYAKSFYMRGGRSVNIGPGLIMLAGFFQSVRPVLGRYVINIDTTSATFYKPGELMDLAMEHMRVRDVRGLSDACARPDGLRKLRAFLKGIYVLPFGSNRKVAIRDIELRAGRYSFDKGGRETTVAEHYQDHHNRRLSYPDAPGIRTSSSAVFPFEICTVIEGQRYKKKLTPEQTTEFMRGSVKKPEVRMGDIASAVGPQVLGYANAPHLAEVGMSVEPRPLRIMARQLNPPDITYGDSVERASQGKWNMLRRKFSIPAVINAWAVVAFVPVDGRMATTIDSFIVQLIKNMENLGIQFAPGRKEPIRRTGNEANVIKDLDDAAWDATEGLPLAANNEREKPSLLIVLLPENAGPLRKAVKRWGDHIRAVPTQCVRERKWENSNDQYRNNVVLKINARCGGVNSVIRNEIMSIVQSSMVIGCDVSHPAPGVKDRPSIASLVASMDGNATRYWAHACCQAPRQEMIDRIGYMLLGALHERRKKGGEAPKNLIIYRDGVSEGEYATVVNREIALIRDAIVKNFPGLRPNLLFIVVTKRHHVRFFPMDKSQGDRTGNCHPGLVVDTDIVHPKLPDFYIQSQAGLIGTSRPSHYIVLCNDANFPIDNIQALSYQLCFVYAPATRSVSIPAPVYYADRVCTRAADSAFKEEGSEGMPAYDASDDASAPQWNDEMLARWNKAMLPNVLSSRMYFV